MSKPQEVEVCPAATELLAWCRGAGDAPLRSCATSTRISRGKMEPK